MDHTVVLAEILGILALVGGLDALFNRKSMAAAIEDVDRSSGFLWTWGFINLLFGAVFIALYNVWTLDWRVLIAIGGWSALVKGAWIILFPDSARAIYRVCNRPGILASGGAIATAVGIILLWVSK